MGLGDQKRDLSLICKDGYNLFAKLKGMGLVQAIRRHGWKGVLIETGLKCQPICLAFFKKEMK